MRVLVLAILFAVSPVLAVTIIGFNTVEPTNFSPSQIASLSLWFDSSDVSTMWTDAGTTQVSTDSDLIYQWDDKSPNGFNVTQATSADRPLYRTNIQNSLSSAEWIDATDLMVRANTNAVDALGVKNQTVYVVQLQDGASSQNATLRLEYSTTEFKAHVTYSNVIYFDVMDNSTSRTQASQPTGWDDTWHVVEYYRSDLNGHIKVDGTELAHDTNIGTELRANGAGDLIIGSRDNPVSQNFIGYIGEIVVFDESLSTADRAAMLTYLNDKWSVY